MEASTNLSQQEMLRSLLASEKERQRLERKLEYRQSYEQMLLEEEQRKTASLRKTLVIAQAELYEMQERCWMCQNSCATAESSKPETTTPTKASLTLALTALAAVLGLGFAKKRAQTRMTSHRRIRTGALPGLQTGGLGAGKAYPSKVGGKS
jgi:hypothetical protein